VARNVISDFLQDNAFWLMDVAPIEPLALPVFTPIAGFSAITAPEIQLEVLDITEGNSLWRKKLVKKADVGAITLSRGTSFWDADFNRWLMAALRGTTEGYSVGFLSGLGGATPRRDLLLIQYFRRTPMNALVTGVLGGTLTTALAAAAASDLGGSSAQAAVLAGLAVSPLGPFELYPKVPARAWLLRGCLPTRYKVGSDFDATSGQVSIMELDVQPEQVEEISLAS
jgi:phage tail-like protein